MEPTGAVVGVMVVATVALVGALASGNGQALCERMGGVYTPVAPPADSCPGGKWSNLFSGAPKAEAKPAAK